MLPGYQHHHIMLLLIFTLDKTLPKYVVVLLEVWCCWSNLDFSLGACTSSLADYVVGCGATRLGCCACVRPKGNACLLRP